jgi:hypothetical protein
MTDSPADPAPSPASTSSGLVASGGVPAASADRRIERRAADLLPEERAAGSADPEAQAQAILEESDEREVDLEAAPDSFLERRTSEQTTDPGDAGP